MQINQTNLFEKAYKKLHKKQKNEVDKYIKKCIENPSLGELKKGDLAGIRTVKFKCSSQQYLLAYDVSHDEQFLILCAIGSHENFYRSVKKHLHAVK